MTTTVEDLSPKEVAKRMLDEGKTEAVVRISYKEMIVTTDFERENFDTFQTFVVDGVRLRLGLVTGEG